MKIGQLVLVRLEDTGNQRRLVPGLVVGKLPPETPPTFEVLVDGETWAVTSRDIGPIDMFQQKDSLEEKYNSDV